MICKTQLNLFTPDQFSFLPSSMRISTDDVHAALELLATTRGSGPGGIAALILYRCRNVVTFYRLLGFVTSHTSMSSFLMSGNVVGLHLKSDSPTVATNYRPVSGPSFLGKNFESIVFNRV